MRFAALAFALVLAGCTTSIDREPPQGLAGSWVLVSATAGSQPLDLNGTEITLDIGSGTARGNAPCNIYELHLSGSPEDIMLGDFVTTERACVEQSRMDLEQRYYELLSTVYSGHAETGTLVLLCEDGELVYDEREAE